MNCKEMRRQLRYGYPSERHVRNEINIHTQNCSQCERYAALDKLAAALVKVQAESEEIILNQDETIVNRTMFRIREMRDRSTSSWESAVLGVRGWLVAFGTAALLLVSIAFLETTKTSTIEETVDITFASNKDVKDTVVILVDEDIEHAHQ